MKIVMVQAPVTSRGFCKGDVRTASIHTGDRKGHFHIVDNDGHRCYNIFYGDAHIKYMDWIIINPIAYWRSKLGLEA